MSGVFSDNLTFSFLLLQNMEKYAVFARVALHYLLVLLGTFITGSPFLHVATLIIGEILDSPPSKTTSGDSHTY